MGLGEVKKLIQDRYERRRRTVKHEGIAAQICDPVERVIKLLLEDYGINYPLDFVKRPPDVDDVSRSQTFKIAPSSSEVLTFRARKHGWLVIEFLNIILEDPIAQASVTVTYKLGASNRKYDYRNDPTVSEQGLWQWGGGTLSDQEVLTVTIANGDANADAIVSIEADAWML